MKTLIPTLARGKYAYQGNSFGRLRPTAAGSSARASTTVDPVVGDRHGKIGSVTITRATHPAANLIQHVPFAHPYGSARGSPILGIDINNNAPPAPCPSSLSSSSKRPFSDLEGCDDLGAAPHSIGSGGRSYSYPSSTTSSKRGRSTGAIALTNIGHTLAQLSSSYTKELEQQQARHRERKSRQNQGECRLVDAIDRAQEIETDLTDDELARLLEAFQADDTNPITYLMIKQEALRKAWVKRKVAQMQPL